jgi:hypothetical protein
METDEWRLIYDAIVKKHNEENKQYRNEIMRYLFVLLPIKWYNWYHPQKQSVLNSLK